MKDHPEILDSERSVFERPIAIKVVWASLILGCAGFAGAGFYLKATDHGHHKPHFEGQGFLGWLADDFPAFYALVGFVSFAFIVLAGQHLRHILMRPEGYYDGAEAELPRNPVAPDAVAVDDMDIAPERGGEAADA